MRQDGNALLITLFTVMVLALLLLAQTAVTHTNVNVAGRRTSSAQLAATVTFRTPAFLQDTAARLPGFLAEKLSTTPPDQLTSAATLQTFQRNLDAAWSQCASGNPRTRLHLAGQSSCSMPDPGAAQRGSVTRNTLSQTGLTEYRLPLYAQVTASDAEGNRRSRAATGEAVLLAMNPMPATAYQLLTGSLTQPIPGALIFDGPVHVQGTLTLDAARSAFLAPVTSSQSALRLGGESRTTAQFRPLPAVPCDPSSSTCPTFGDGLALGAAALNLPSVNLSAQAALTLPGSVREVVLSPHPSGGTLVYACTSTACDRYWLQPSGSAATLWQHSLSSPVPPRNGLIFQPPEPASGSPWTQRASGVLPIILAPNALEVRALMPTGPAYQGALTLAAKGTLTVTSSLLAQAPVCDSYPVRDADASLRPASCTQTSPDQFGLVSEGGGIDLGNSSLTLADQDASLTLHAALLAPQGAVALRDSRLQKLDLVGSVTSLSFTPDARMRLAFDPRVRRPPGFPDLGITVTPPAVIFQGDTNLDLP